jgi:hypothetical protein
MRLGEVEVVLWDFSPSLLTQIRGKVRKRGGSGSGVRKEEEGELGFGAERIKRGGRWEWWCVGGGPRSHA